MTTYRYRVSWICVQDFWRATWRRRDSSGAKDEQTLVVVSHGRGISNVCLLARCCAEKRGVGKRIKIRQRPIRQTMKWMFCVPWPKNLWAKCGIMSWYWSYNNSNMWSDQQLLIPTDCWFVMIIALVSIDLKWATASWNESWPRRQTCHIAKFYHANLLLHR